MQRDEIVDEVRAIREEYAARFNYDLRAICNDLKDKQANSGRQTVSLPPREASQSEPQTTAA